ncbi:MAG: glycosyltransferase family 61 protein, partial [Pseudomonadota bacterium]
AVHLVTPTTTPGYIGGAAAFFGFRHTATDAQLSGAGVAYDLDPWTTVRASRADWVAAPAARDAFTRGRTMHPSGAALPRRAYLSRKSARSLENEDEICALLGERGFERIFAETLSVADQIGLFQEAEAIVAIHGAALGPLLWRQPESTLAHVVELMPCGHMTDYYRGMCAQLGVGWIGVRGRLKPEYVAPAYDFGKRFKAFSQDDFTVDPASLTHALDLAGL